MQVRAAVVTGAAQGLGLALVEALAHRGSDVLMIDVNSRQLESAAVEVRRATRRTVLTLAADVTSAGEVEAAARLAERSFGEVHLAANVAGIIGPADRPIWEVPAEEVQRLLDINLGGVLNGIRAFVPLLVEHGQPAVVINMASMAGFMATSARAPYVMSKHAVVGLTEALRFQLAERHRQVRAMLVAPGPVSTPLLEAAEHQGGRRPDAPPIRPAEAATRILRALDAGEFYVFTNPGSESRISGRFDEILEGCCATDRLAAEEALPSAGSPRRDAAVDTP